MFATLVNKLLISTTMLSGLLVLVIGLASPTVIQAHVLDNVPLVDGHNDLAYNLYGLLKNDLTTFDFQSNLTSDAVFGKENCPSCFTDLVRLRAGKVGSQFWAAYVSCQVQYKDGLAKTLEQIDVIKRLVDRYPDDMQFVTTSQGIVEAFENKKIGSLIGVEGGHSMDSRLSILRTFYDLGVRYMTLTHSCNTPWADNSYVDDTNPVHNLTDFGKLVVKEMNRLGMMVDLSHVSHNVMNQAILTSRAPVIFSHSSAYNITPHNRNVQDETLKLLADNNGIVMVNFYNGFISSTPDTASIKDVIAHINYIANVAGVDHVGIGGDYDGVSRMPSGLEDVSKYPNLFDALEESNPTLWTVENLEKLASKNLIRVFQDVERIRDALKDEAPYQSWISFDELNAMGDEIWRCRTLLNNTSPEN